MGSKGLFAFAFFNDSGLISATMLKFILLLLMTAPQQGGKVILNAGIPEADFYLDGNFVAATDDKGMLIMENFPAGSFSYSVEKKGYSTFKGSFTIGEGETKLLEPALQKMQQPEERRKQTDSPRKAPPAADPAQSAVPLQQVLKEVPQSITGDTFEKKPVATQSETQSAPGGEGFNPLRFLGLVLPAIALILLAAIILRRKRREPLFANMGADFEPDIQPPSAEAPNRPDPGFIEALRRREELMNAGYVPGKSRNTTAETMKEKEVVIVLPKEAFRVEDDQ